MRAAKTNEEIGRAMQPITIIDRRRAERGASAGRPAAPAAAYARITERAAVAAVEAFFGADAPQRRAAPFARSSRRTQPASKSSQVVR